MIDFDDDCFERNYSIHTIDSQSEAPSFDFSSNPNKRNVISLEITNSNGFKWIANFHDGVCGIAYQFMATPSPDCFCAIVHGIGYWINIHQPQSYITIDLCPIISAISLPKKRLIVFNDHTDMHAYNENGLLWSIKDLSHGGIQILEANSERIKAMVFYPPEDRVVQVSLDGTFCIEANHG